MFQHPHTFFNFINEFEAEIMQCCQDRVMFYFFGELREKNSWDERDRSLIVINRLEVVLLDLDSRDGASGIAAAAVDASVRVQHRQSALDMDCRSRTYFGTMSATYTEVILKLKSMVKIFLMCIHLKVISYFHGSTLADHGIHVKNV